MIVDRQFHNIKCDACGRLIDDETWWDDKEALTTQILIECNWIECEGRHYCDECWEYDDDDNIQCKDGRKYTENNELIEQPVNPDEMQDGDIISGGECIAIYKGIDREKKYRGTSGAIIYHACTNTVDGHTSIGPKIGIGSFAGVTFHKAYTDERDLLFARLKAKGYRWTGHGLIKED